MTLEQIANPYDPISAVTEPHMFVGREAEIEEIIYQRLSSSTPISTILIGGRKIGKTSLLYRIQSLLLSDRLVQDLSIIPVFFSCHEHAMLSIKNIYQNLISKLVATIEQILGTLVIFSDDIETDPYRIFETQLWTIFDHCAEHLESCKFVLLIDEAEKLLGQDWSEDFFGNLRYLINTSPLKSCVSLVLTGFREVHDFVALQNDSPLGNAAYWTYLSVLTKSQSKKLVSTPFKDELSNEIFAVVYNLSDGHPFIVQFLMHKAWRPNHKEISTSDINKASRSFSKTTKVFVSWKEKFSSLDDEVFNILCRIQIPISLENIRNRLQIKKTTGEIKDSLNFLYYTGVVSEDNNLFISSGQLFSQWFIERYHSTPENDWDYMKHSSITSVIPKALIMKGGGVKGLAYVGALREIVKYNHFNWYVGTSAGAIAAILLGAGYSIDELESILSEKNFSDFLDAKLYQLPTNLIFYKGLFPADEFTNWLERKLAEKLETSYEVRLSHLPNRVTVYASRRGKRALIFDSKDTETMNTPAAFAARCSMAIPFVFWPQMDRGMRVLDGGIQNNYPVDILLQEHPETDFIGLYLGPEIYEGENRRGWLFSDLISIWTEAADAEALEKYQNQTVIIDPRPISTIDFNLSEDEKTFLMQAGRTAALKFLLRKNTIAQISKEELENAQSQTDELRQSISINRQRKKRKSMLVMAVVMLLTVLVIFFILNLMH